MKMGGMNRYVASFALVLLVLNNILIAAPSVASASSYHSSWPRRTRCIRRRYPALFVFGDSLSDTGNGPLTGNSFFQRTTMAPYGETFPGRPASRFSDGRLLIDFLARYLGLPYVNPSLNETADFTRGVNYAVSGATTLNQTFLNSKLIFPLTNDSLEVQLHWHLSLQASVASRVSTGKPKPSYFSTGLYVVCFGGNDYTSASRSPALYSSSFINATFVPLVISKIKDVTEILHANGARNFLFIGLPLGCSPSLLSTNLTAPRDKYGCNMDFNSVSFNHGIKLLKEVQNLRTRHPDGTFMFADYYGAYEYTLKNSAAFGFNNTLDACCGAGPSYPYRFNTTLFCNSLSGMNNLTLCTNPNNYINWDGIHYTDHFNNHIANQTFFTGNFLDPKDGLDYCVKGSS